jgi:transposase-like protein
VRRKVVDERIETRWVDGGYRDVVVPWSQTASGRALTKEQGEAAHLLAVLKGDAERVDTVLELDPGTTGQWLATDENFRRVAIGLFNEYYPAEDRMFEFSRILKPKQLEAAHLYYEQALTQAEVARRLKVTDRTLRNWAADPAFRAYGESLRRARNERLTQESQTREIEILERLGEQRKRAMKVVDGALSGGDARVAIELLRPWLKGR